MNAPLEERVAALETKVRHLEALVNRQGRRIATVEREAANALGVHGFSIMTEAEIADMCPCCGRSDR